MVMTRLVEDRDCEAADLWLINTCTVKNPSQAAMGTLLKRGQKLGKRLLVSGCVPQVRSAGVESSYSATSRTPLWQSSSFFVAVELVQSLGLDASSRSSPFSLQGDKKAKELEGLSVLGELLSGNGKEREGDFLAACGPLSCVSWKGPISFVSGILYRHQHL